MNRAVIVFMSRRKGIPVSQSHFPFLNGAIPSSELDIGVGVIGDIPRGDGADARVGIYQFSGNEMRLHHVVDLNPRNGNPVPRKKKTPGVKDILCFDRATVNWMKPLMFMDNVYPPGLYSWRDDPPVPIDQVDVEERRRIVGLASIAPREDFFSMERTIESASHMIDKFIEFGGMASHPQKPQLFPLITTSTLRKIGRISGISAVSIPRDVFRSMSLQKMAQGLRSREGAFLGIRHGYANLQMTIDRMAAQSAQRILVESTIKRASNALRQDAEEHISRQRLDPLKHKECMASVDLAIECLLSFYVDRSPAGITAFGISSSDPAVVNELKEQVFNRPDFLMVRPSSSIIVVESNSLSLSFSEDGADIFR